MRIDARYLQVGDVVVVDGRHRRVVGVALMFARSASPIMSLVLHPARGLAPGGCVDICADEPMDVVGLSRDELTLRMLSHSV